MLGQGEKPYTYCKLTTETHKLLPLCRAIFLILDELAEYDDIEEDEDGRISLDEYSQVQSVLMVRAGDESHLSAPITFEHIRKQEFQLKRDGCDLEGVEVIRVSLAVAVEFITTLQQREDAATPSEMNNHSIDRSICPSDAQGHYVDLALSAEVWAEKILQQADELGFENCLDAEDALIRALNARKEIIHRSSLHTPSRGLGKKLFKASISIRVFVSLSSYSRRKHVHTSPHSQRSTMILHIRQYEIWSPAVCSLKHA
jgi:hypothetical protein